MAFIELQNATKKWAGAVGIDNVSLSIAKGSFVVLLGPSGCGKSTTLRIIAGLEQPDQGRVLIDGRDVTGVPPSKRGISMVFQSYALFPHLNVAENIVFGLKVRGVGRAERDERLETALARTGLKGYELRKPAQLSGGQRQRVALARAIIADHPICLMDEPLSNLDAKLRHSVRQEIRSLQRQLDMTVIYVTHDQTEAMAMADVVVLMKDGKIEQAGSPASLYEEPATAFSASFVGTPPMTLLPASGVPEALLPQPPQAAAKENLILGIRPESIRVTAGSANGLQGTVQNAEFMGAETFLYAGTAAGPLIARLPGRVSRAPGERISLEWDRGDAVLFDKTSGRRLESNSGNAGQKRAVTA
ncbi:MAG: ABC transporter ATP-binding protein [Xanthobacteraceae bacterium]|nr:ABC transporter ATP-binding protein [Xanthobacteraceae bacterium]MBX3522068.1 ABC transporter ATP-binding protein [Xanthobacteraceae bacterium]MBX3535663.1 ABC transporter ATP-binding protein [Xanthobacteraceae bacterium]MCW5674026.1 ABC transporter ATP-binding protein [Xanthobacteraceae bacterium]MCW5678162.1 ABC transporter ATP-binding protein [Xanthobacteraceae bacterium]